MMGDGRERRRGALAMSSASRRARASWCRHDEHPLRRDRLETTSRERVRRRSDMHSKSGPLQRSVACEYGESSSLPERERRTFAALRTVNGSALRQPWLIDKQKIGR